MPDLNGNGKIPCDKCGTLYDKITDGQVEHFFCAGGPNILQQNLRLVPVFTLEKSTVYPKSNIPRIYTLTTCNSWLLFLAIT